MAQQERDRLKLELQEMYVKKMAENEHEANRQIQEERLEKERLLDERDKLER